MRLHTIDIRRLLLAALILWSGTVSGLFAITPVAVDVKPYQGGFVLARANGTIVWTDIEGNATDSVKIRTGIAGIDVREGSVLAVSPDGSVYSVERNGKSRRLCKSQLKNSADHVVGIACSMDNTLILTEGGVILGTADFDSFSSFDFNGTYSQYYDFTLFCAISASDNFFYIAGTFGDGMPAVFTSATGKVWSERTLDYTEGRESLRLEEQPLGLAYDRRMDRFVMACTEGWLFYMPGCSHCNSIERRSVRDIAGVAFNEGKAYLLEF